MDDRNNTMAGWILAGGIAALGLSIASATVFHSERPEKMGYEIQGVVSSDGESSGPPLAALLAAGDAANGANVFKKCVACHTVNAGGANGIGPNLYGTMGEAIAQGKGGFAFSDALKSVGGSWTFEQMDAWLKSPRKFAAGTKMTFAGLGDPQDRADILLYLNAQGSNLPLPAPPPEEAAGEGEEQEVPVGVSGAVGDDEPAAEGSNTAPPVESVR